MHCSPTANDELQSALDAPCCCSPVGLSRWSVAGVKTARKQVFRSNGSKGECSRGHRVHDARRCWRRPGVKFCFKTAVAAKHTTHVGAEGTTDVGAKRTTAVAAERMTAVAAKCTRCNERSSELQDLPHTVSSKTHIECVCGTDHTHTHTHTRFSLHTLCV